MNVLFSITKDYWLYPKHKRVVIVPNGFFMLFLCLYIMHFCTTHVLITLSSLPHLHSNLYKCLFLKCLLLVSSHFPRPNAEWESKGESLLSVPASFLVNMMISSSIHFLINEILLFFLFYFLPFVLNRFSPT